MNLRPDPLLSASKIDHIIALNEDSPGSPGFRTNQLERAKILARHLPVDVSVAKKWLKGNFRKQTLTGEEFIRFVQIYRGKRGFSDVQDVIDLAVYLYGDRYKAKLALVGIDPDPDQHTQTQSDHDGPVGFIPNHFAARIARGFIYQYGDEAHLQKAYEQQYAQHPQIPLINHEIYAIVAVAIQKFTRTERASFAALGTLPRLASYSKLCFAFLWEQEGDDTLMLLDLFEKLNLIHPICVGAWKIDAQILRVSEQYLLSQPSKAQKRIRNWWKRALATPEIRKAYGNVFKQNNVVYANLFDAKALQERRKRLGVHNYKRNSLFAYLLKKLLISGYDSDWEYIHIYAPHLTSDQYLYASFLLANSRRELRIFLLDVSLFFLAIFFLARIILWLAIPVVAITLWIIVQFVKKAFLYDAAWADLWEELIPRIKAEA